MEVQILNGNGKYIFQASAYFSEKVAFFIPIEEGMQLISQRALQGFLKTYTIKKVAKNAPVLNIPVEKVTLVNTNSNKLVEILLAGNIKTKFGLFFEYYRMLEGTPIQFYDDECNDLIHYRAVSIETKKISNEIFNVSPTYKILTLEQLRK